jgi:hypothetical protein
MYHQAQVLELETCARAPTEDARKVEIAVKAHDLGAFANPQEQHTHLK